jgi:hypothetical protein
MEALEKILETQLLPSRSPQSIREEKVQPPLPGKRQGKPVLLSLYLWLNLRLCISGQQRRRCEAAVSVASGVAGSGAGEGEDTRKRRQAEQDGAEAKWPGTGDRDLATARLLLHLLVSIPETTVYSLTKCPPALLHRGP